MRVGAAGECPKEQNKNVATQTKQNCITEKYSKRKNTLGIQGKRKKLPDPRLEYKQVKVSKEKQHTVKKRGKREKVRVFLNLRDIW